MAKRGLNAAEVALRLGTTERNVIRLKNTDVEPCPTTTFHGSARTAKPSN
jgi:DNA-binding Xre family transcriptional regulator